MIKEDNIRKWNTVVEGCDPGATPKSIFTSCGAPCFDVDRFINDDIGDIQIKRFENYIKYTDEAAPEVLEYWRKKGLIKEMHSDLGHTPIPQRYVDRLARIGVCANREEAQTRWDKWASYVPVSSLEDKTRKYPLMFLLHGGDDPIYMCETYGFLDLAAEKELIVIAPTDAGYENVGKLLDYALKYYPVDATRVYCAGFSGGAAKTEDTIINYPERFAGAIMVGQLFRTKFYGDPTEEHLHDIKNIKIAAINIEGITEAGRTLPMNISQEYNTCIPDVVRKVSDNCEGLNWWLEFIGSEKKVTEAEMFGAAHSADPVERAVGTVFDKTHVERHFERDFYFGDYLDTEGNNLLRVVGVEQVPHWPVPGFAEITWDFISRFSRNVETGELIIGE